MENSVDYYIMRWMNGLSVRICSMDVVHMLSIRIQLDIDRNIFLRDPNDLDLIDSSIDSISVELVRDGVAIESTRDHEAQAPIHMGISRVSRYIHSGCRVYAKSIQEDIQQFGCILSSNGRSKVSIDQIYDHIDIPSYPKTSINGVGHFIHFETPIIQDSSTASEIYHIAKRQMSKVYSAYALYIRS